MFLQTLKMCNFIDQTAKTNYNSTRTIAHPFSDHCVTKWPLNIYEAFSGALQSNFPSLSLFLTSRVAHKLFKQ